MVVVPKLFTMPWMKILPTETKLCCKMLGMAMRLIFSSRRKEKSLWGAWGSFFSRSSTAAMAHRQLTPWHRKVAQATPSTPMPPAVTKRMSTPMLLREETIRNRKGVRESPMAEKMPVAML